MKAFEVLVSFTVLAKTQIEAEQKTEKRLASLRHIAGHSMQDTRTFDSWCLLMHQPEIHAGVGARCEWTQFTRDLTGRMVVLS